ncbi:MAG: transposase, partial [Gammaproteobacteria bacterium]|nr:transposase [Gammaproteobacteria bacterium]
NIDPEAWLPSIRYYGKHFKYAVGTVELLRQFSGSVNKSWVHGISASQALYRRTIH